MVDGLQQRQGTLSELANQTRLLRRRQRRPRAGANQAGSPPATHKVDAARPQLGRLGKTAEAQEETSVRLVNVRPYQPIRGTLCLPPDCWELNDFDWTPLDPAPRSKAAPVPAAQGDKQGQSGTEEQVTNNTPTQPNKQGEAA